MARVIAATDEELRAVVAASSSFYDVAEALGYSKASTYTLTLRIKRLGLDTRHFKRARHIGRLPYAEIFCRHSPASASYIKSLVLRDRLIDYKCTECGNEGEHNGRKLVLHLDHIDGDRTNDELSNLRFLCPNCHTQTHTYAGRNKSTSASRKR